MSTPNLRAGELQLDFEPNAGMIRDVRWRGVEVLRAIYGAVRDADWNTAPAVFQLVEEYVEADRFRLTLEAECCTPSLDFHWRCEISGEADSTLAYRFYGEARRDFLKNRIGLCVLHPMLTCEGRPCRLETVDGLIKHLAFPRLIEPSQPFLAVRRLSFPIGQDRWLTTAFEGDEFETEDQRNWSDASFKTYSTPLEHPFPVLVRAGARVQQVVTVALEQETAPAVHAGPLIFPAKSDETLSVGSTIRLPRLGLGVSRAHDASREAALEWSRRLRLDHLRLDLHLEDKAWTGTLERGLSQAAAWNAALHLAMHAGPAGAAGRLADVKSQVEQSARDGGAAVSAWLLFQEGEPVTPEPLLETARAILGEQATIVVGTDAHLAELNRHHSPWRSANGVVFSLTPQVHAQDIRTIVESLETHERTVATVKSFAGEVPSMVSPITLRPRFNAVATSGQARRESEGVDPRQADLFVAGWVLGGVVEWARGSVSAATYFECVGPCGVIVGPESHAEPARVTPACHVFADLADVLSLDAAELRPLATGVGWRAVQGLWANDGRKHIILLANLGDVARHVRLPEALASRATPLRFRLLDEGARRAAMSTPLAFRNDHWRDADTSPNLDLPPWAYLRIEATER